MNIKVIQLTGGRAASPAAAVPAPPPRRRASALPSREGCRGAATRCGACCGAGGGCLWGVVAVGMLPVSSDRAVLGIGRNLVVLRL